MPVVDEFYIIAESGLCYYSKSRKKEIDKTLFSALLTALNSLSEEIASKSIDSLVLQNEKYIISRLGQIMFIVRTGTKTRDSAIRKELAEMKQIFLLYFSPKELEANWDGDLNRFKVLDKHYDRFFLESVKTRMESLF
ncbi:MAG: hypothetical protein RBG13Loki_0786 [Promethearchaeota archaeon CR_4]|nr:MAG: hypothetical protein RBG13Loki_0786 [Candidatus Lokiarchaeota archaeon CR_4]